VNIVNKIHFHAVARPIVVTVIGARQYVGYQDQDCEAQHQDSEPTDKDMSKIFCVPCVVYKNTIRSNNITLQ